MPPWLSSFRPTAYTYAKSSDDLNIGRIATLHQPHSSRTFDRLLQARDEGGTVCGTRGLGTFSTPVEARQFCKLPWPLGQTRGQGRLGVFRSHQRIVIKLERRRVARWERLT